VIYFTNPYGCSICCSLGARASSAGLADTGGCVGVKAVMAVRWYRSRPWSGFRSSRTGQTRPNPMTSTQETHDTPPRQVKDALRSLLRHGLLLGCPNTLVRCFSAPEVLSALRGHGGISCFGRRLPHGIRSASLGCIAWTSLCPSGCGGRPCRHSYRSHVGVSSTERGREPSGGGQQ
jgi:hypothetical protein